MIKRFLEWMKLKMKIHERAHCPPHVSEGDIWWVNIGDNVGQEINGKGKNFARPVYIYQKLSSDFYLVLRPLSINKEVGMYPSCSRQELLLCVYTRSESWTTED